MKAPVREIGWLIRHGAVVVLAMVALPGAGLAAPAARMEFAVGDVQIMAPGGQARPGRKGAQVNSGETVSTNHGRAQLRFSDGAYVSLQPQSDFRIDDYRFEGKADGSERGFFSLLKGGLRTITGLVGRANKRNYQVNTAVATIGIRGTEYTIAYTNSITGSIGEGEIDVCTVRCVAFGSGESFVVVSADTLPRLTFKKTDLPPPQPDDATGGSFGDQSDPNKNPGGAIYVASDNVTPDGLPAGLMLAGTWDNMTVGDNQNMYAINDVLRVQSGQTVQFSSTGVPQSIGGVGLSSLAEYGNRDFIAWGRGVDPFGSGYFFITGPSMLESDLAALQISQPVATYQFIGGTAPIGSSSRSGSPMVGELLGGTLTAYFGLSQVDASVSVRMDGVGLDIASKGMAISGKSGAVTFENGSCTLAGGSCNMKGFFVGSNAGGAGVVYEAFANGGIPTDTVQSLAAPLATVAPSSVSASGAAAFVKSQ